MTMLLQLILVLGLMVLVHEFGHFAAAKLFGVRVESFAFGFGRRLAGIRHGGTDYRINLLPFGGYVKMAGELPGQGNSGDPGNLNNHPRWQRVIITLAGPIANFILAFCLMTCAFMLHTQVDPYSSGPAVTDYISRSTPIAATGLRTGDTISHFDTIDNPTWEDIFNHASLIPNRTVLLSFIQDGRRMDTTFYLSFAGHPEDFNVQSALELGLVPRMQSEPIEVESLIAGGSSQRAGLLKNDQIVSVNRLPIRSMPALFWYLRDHSSEPVSLTVLRNKQHLNLQVTPQASTLGDGLICYQLGFTARGSRGEFQHLAFASSLAASYQFSRKNSLLVVDVLTKLLERQTSVKNLSGPIGIGQAVHHAAAAPGWLPLIATIATISINLGIFNLLPFPILDGGMIFLLIVEGTFQRDLSVQVKKQIYHAAFVCIVLFAVMVIFNDITKLPFVLKLKS